MKKLLLGATFVLGTILCAQAQGYYNLNYLSNPGNPGGINTDFDFINTFNPPTGVTEIIGHTDAPKYSSGQTLPFVFKFNGGPVTKFTASSSGYITFTKGALLVAGNIPQTLPSASMPDSSICVWGLCTAGKTGVGEVYTKLYGIAPHRQLWITWFAATNPVDTSSINFWSIALEETTNNIYLVDESGAYRWNNVNTYTAPNLTLGIQESASLAYEITGSPNINALTTNNTSGSNTFNDYYEFLPIPQPAFSAQVVSSKIGSANAVYGVGKPYTVNANIANIGSTALSSLTLNWEVDGLPPVNSNATTVSIASPNPVVAGNAVSTINLIPATPGVHTMKIWVTKLNGSNANADLNDTLTVHFLAVNAVVTKDAVYEEFTGQSCVYCMIAAPNMDSVYDNNTYNSNIVRYHVPIPERDFIYVATEAQVNTRMNYYGVNFAPDGYMDGSYLDPSTYQTPNPQNRYSSTTIQDEDALGSALKINITSAKYIEAKDSFFVSADITAYTAFPDSLTAQVALTIDSLTYKYDLSMEDPASSFAVNSNYPQFKGGAGSYTNAPDYYYDYELKFTHVEENMFPSPVGTKLGTFTANQTRTISFGWKKNHAWGAYDKPVLQRDSDYYDSSSTGQFVVFVQTKNGIPAYSMTSQYILQSAWAPVTGIVATGIQEITEGVSFKMYPNPTNNNTTLAFSLTRDQNVNLEVYNMLGERVFADNRGILSTGQHTLAINGSNLQNGLYLVRLITDSGTTIQKLLIQR